MVAVLLVATAHFVPTAISFIASPCLTFPGEPGFDAVAEHRAEVVGSFFGILVFQFIPLLSKGIPRALTTGLLGWIWFAANSLLWASAIVFAWKVMARRLYQPRQRRLDAA